MVTPVQGFPKPLVFSALGPVTSITTDEFSLSERNRGAERWGLRFTHTSLHGAEPLEASVDGGDTSLGRFRLSTAAGGGSLILPDGPLCPDEQTVVKALHLEGPFP